MALKLLTLIVAFTACLLCAASVSAGDTVQPNRLTLAEIVDQAVAGYPGIRARGEAVSAAQASAMAAQWGFFPSPSITAETNDGDADLVAEISQPLWSGGRLEANVDLAKAQLNVSQWALLEAKHDVALRVIEQYEAFTSAAMVSAAYEQYVADLTDFGAMMQRRVAQGYSAEVDASLVASRLSQARDVQTNLNATRQRALASLSELIGAPLLGHQVDLPDMDVGTNDLLVGDFEFLSRVEHVNPRLNRLAAEVGVARAQLRQARSSVWPTVSVKAQHREFGNGASSDGRVFVSLDFAWGAGLSVVEGVRSAEFEKGEATSDQAAYRVDLRSVIRSDLHSLRASEALVKSLAANQRTQRNIYESYVRMFLVGQRTWLDVLNIMREAVEAERSLAAARATYAATRFRLRVFIGDVAWSS